MGLFKKKKMGQSYDKENKKPVIKASICNGEQIAGFKDCLLYTSDAADE